MSKPTHTLGPTCAFYDGETDEPDLNGPPTLPAQFFYVSSLPIDDPLSPLPPVSAEKATDLPPQPFSAKDNAALEEAWQDLQDMQSTLTDEERERRNNLATGVFSFPQFKTKARTPKATAVSGSEVMLDNHEPPVEAQELLQNTEPDPKHKHRHFSPFQRHKVKDSSRDSSLERPESSGAGSVPKDQSMSDLSRRPFARAPSGRNISSSTARESKAVSDGSRSRSRSAGRKPRTVFVPVGVSRLHLVEVPDLVMKPIYWSPINDNSNVIRATWFYKETMLPVPVDVANRLELGYEYIKPFDPSYQDELQACIDNGAAAETKVVYKLWPAKLSTDNEDERDRKDMPEIALNAAADPQRAWERRLFSTHSVIYTDTRNAQILKPNLLPSTSQNRRPLNALRKGRQIGIAVVRGFDRRAWLKIHPDPKLNATGAKAKVGAYMSQSGDATTRARRPSCVACEQTDRPTVSDLVLVIHGIGQKLSERVDSFHFTHAINGLRREFNVELADEVVKGNLKKDTGIMVLPVNWRLTVSFDDDVKTAEDDNTFDLQAITPETLPAVRSIISDVMLDIPYYLSHHKEKMTSAVVREANRVYRLWCRNNPGFAETGRVHLIAHSLGTVMAMEILSRQPTRLGNVKLDSKTPTDKFFEFDTTNLFCCGSPAGFFLLLNNATLVPRKGRNKPGMECEDKQSEIASEARYGCLAIDNIYNIVHRNDPISYLVNAAVDKDYAKSLQPALIPSATQSLMTRLGRNLPWASASTSDTYARATTTDRPTLTSLPSQVEMDTHDFSREEIAEKRMYLLNDNGQIDWFLSAGAGPLEFQYLNMLGAHSSYWLLRDFVRFLVVEIGREPGRENAVPSLRARKRRDFKRGEI